MIPMDERVPIAQAAGSRTLGRWRVLVHRERVTRGDTRVVGGRWRVLVRLERVTHGDTRIVAGRRGG
jgi:hypothetical protein